MNVENILFRNISFKLSILPFTTKLCALKYIFHFIKNHFISREIYKTYIASAILLK